MQARNACSLNELRLPNFEIQSSKLERKIIQNLVYTTA